MPVLLSGHTMTPVQILRPEKMQLNLRIDGLSTASMELDNESPDVAIGAWVQIWAPNGEMCVMYVKNRSKDYITGNITLTLEHTFGLLQSMVVFGEVTAATMSGSSGATTCTVTQAITYLLNQQTETLWTKDAVDFNDAQGWKFTNSDIYSDLKSLTDAIMDCQWEFDQTSLPWKLKLKAWPVSSTMEMRRNRNLETLQITYDRSGMYTRVYPTGKNNLHIDSVNSNVSYLDQNTGTYGVIANVITDSSINNATLLKAWAQKQLKKNSVPKVSVTISGYELSEATGETLDKLVIGRLCRIPLPEYSETVTERLTELSWKNCIAQPDAVTCTLANELKTITGVLNEKAGGGGGGSKKANTEHDCELQEDEEKIYEFENSDIWINRDSVWAVCGSYTVIESASGRKLIVNDGTALIIERNHTEYGVYDEGSLTGGICVQKINDGSTDLKIIADRIDIDGVVTALAAEYVSVAQFAVVGTSEFGDSIEVYGNVSASGNVTASADGTISGGTCSCTTLDADNIKAGGSTHGISWKSATFIKTIGVSNSTLRYTDDQGSSASKSVVISVGHTDGSINYLGY